MTTVSPGIPAFAPRQTLPIFAWLTAAAVLATAMPVFIRLPVNIPGLQSLTPHKVILPLLMIALAHHLSIRPGRWLQSPVVIATAALFAWFLASVLANPQTYLTYNLRAWSWMALDLAFVVGVEQTWIQPGGRRLLVRSLVFAVMFVTVVGFLELMNLAALDGFFRMFRPDWAALGLTGPGPDTVLPLHACLGGQMRLMSTLSNDVGWAMGMGSVMFAGLSLFAGGASRERSGSVALVGSYALLLIALLLTFSRGAILALGVALLFLLGASYITRPALRMRTAVVAILTVFIIGSQLFSNAGLRAKFAGLRPAGGWTAPAGSADPVAALPVAAGCDALAGSKVANATVTRTAEFSVTQRAQMARVAFVMTSDHPVFGVGFANFRSSLYEAPEYAGRFAVQQQVDDIQDPHNFFLWTSAVAGIPALLLLLLIFAAAARTLFRAVARQPDEAGTALTLAAAWVMLFVFMFVGFGLTSAATQGALAVIVGATAGIGRERIRRPSSDGAVESIAT